MSQAENKSDSDDDNWFDKDEDELLQELQDKTKEHAAPNFVEKIDTPKEKAALITKVHKKTTVYPPGRIETAMLRKIIDKNPLEMFLYVATKTGDDFDVLLSSQIDEQDSQTRIVLYTLLLSSLYKLILPGFMDEILLVFASNDTLIQLLSFHIVRLFDKRFVTLWSDMSSNERFIESLECLLLHSYEAKYLKDNGKGLMETIHRAMTMCNRDDLKETKSFQNFKAILTHLLETMDISTTSFDNEDNSLFLFRRHCDILPTLEELVSKPEEFSKENALKETPNNCPAYLKKQMYLLREDFMISLRERVSELKKFQDLSIDTGEIVWKNVRIVSNNELLTANRNEILYVDILGTSRTDKSIISKKQKEAMSKIKIGSLLCFTRSFNFDNLILATASYTNINVLRNGFIGIEIKNQYHIGSIYNIDLIMFESPTFFEPYNNVYSYLKNCSLNDFPMQNYIVGEKMDVVKPPEYLKDSTTYNFGKVKWKVLREPVPAAVNLNLNESQREAFQHGLTHEMSLIQGPPGTGKTHTSVEIVKSLLDNKQNAGLSKTPIILITYTNDSLDKFLLKISGTICSDILRFGSQSRLEEIKQYNASNTVDSDLVAPELKRFYFMVKTKFVEKFEELRKLQEDFDGSEESYQLMLKAIQEFRKHQQKLDTVRNMFKYYSAKNMSLIAMTSTAAAKMNSLFRFLKSPLVIFEEAAEILESHILASTTPFTKHIIMIGDHKQLKPYNSNYFHSRTYDLNVSLFERLIKKGITYASLDTQYRMRPEIADLLSPTFYKNFTSDPTVENYPPIKGLSKNLFFLNHSFEENKQQNEKSFTNYKEIVILLELAEHLINECHYNGTDIVILSPYVKQVENFRFQKTVLDNGIEAHTVDSFQGLEANIILLSLVRNNPEKEIGFLKEDNRVCVALSRAKLGLYIAGNIDMLSEKSKTWKFIKKKLQASNCIGDQFPYV